jgi:ion channel
VNDTGSSDSDEQDRGQVKYIQAVDEDAHSVATDRPSHRPDVPGQHDDESGYRFGGVLLLVIVTFTFLASGPSGNWVPLVTISLEGAALLSALMAARTSRLVVRLAAAVVALGLVQAVVVLVTGVENGVRAGMALSALLCLGVPIAIGMSLWRRQVVDRKTVLGALVVYVSIGLTFAFLAFTIHLVQGRPYFVQTPQETTATFLYYSFVTLTTVGYGDFTPAPGLGQALAALEGMSGQLYLVTVVAVLVSNIRPRLAVKQE